MPTARGDGVWGNQAYRVILTTRSRRYTSSSGNVGKTLTDYVFTFESSSGSINDRRIFASPEKRTAFLAASFTELSLREIPGSLRKWAKVPSPVESVVGRVLMGVSYIMDYLALELPPCGFYVYNWPVLFSRGKTKCVADEGYREMLQDFIGRRVTRFEEYLDKGLTLEFDGGSSISVPVRVASDDECPEVAQFCGPNAPFCFWQANEEPFD